MAEASEPRLAPSATGTLASRPLLHLLVYARNRRLSGTLEVREVTGASGSIALWRGRISSVCTVPPSVYFGTVAYELGFIDTATLDGTLLEISKTKELHGAVLVRRGNLSAVQRDEILSEQACRKLHPLFAFTPEAIFDFYDAKPTAEEPTFLVDPLKPAWRGLRDKTPGPNIRDVLERYASAALRVTNEAPLTSAGFTAEETALCEALTHRPMTLAQMRLSTVLPSDHVDLLAYLLIITKCAEPASADAAPTSSAQPSIRAAPVSQPGITGSPRSSRPSMPAMPRTILTPGPPDVAAMRRVSTPGMRAAVGSGGTRVSLSFRVPSGSSAPGAAGTPISSRAPRLATTLTPSFGPADLGAAGIAHRAQSVDTEDFFEALGLPDGAPTDAARAAYFRLAKLWHPDRLPAEFEPFRSEVEKVFAHMTRASATLTDTDARRVYLETRDQNAAATTIASRPRADVIRDIETAIGKREFAVAEQTAGHLVDLDAEDAEAMALAAWARAQAGEAPEETLRTTLPQLDKAVHTDTYCERAHFYRGVLHKRLGSSAAAFRDFARVVQLNPRHVDAQREIRIFEMRARKGSGEHAIDALISKTKKK